MEARLIEGGFLAEGEWLRARRSEFNRTVPLVVMRRVLSAVNRGAGAAAQEDYGLRSLGK